MKVSIPGFILAKPTHDWDEGPDVVDGHSMTFHVCEMSNYGYVTVCPHTVEFEMPEGWEPRAQQIEALQEKKRQVTAVFNKTVTEINAQINNLLALEAA